MKTLLAINSSGRVTGSVTRRLTARLVDRLRDAHHDLRILNRDVGVIPPSPVSEPWIAAAFADPASRGADATAALQESETLIQEIDSADAIVLGVPMYNFGIPAQLKAYFDQIVRIGRSFAYHPDLSEPYEPLLAPRPCAVIMSVSDAALLPGGALAHLNLVETHLRTLWAFVGITELVFVRVVDTEVDLHEDKTLATVDAAAERISRRLFPRTAPNRGMRQMRESHARN